MAPSTDRGGRTPYAAPDTRSARTGGGSASLRPSDDGFRGRNERATRTGPSTPESGLRSVPPTTGERSGSRTTRTDGRGEPSPGFRRSGDTGSRAADGEGRDRLPPPSSQGDRYRGGTGYRGENNGGHNGHDDGHNGGHNDGHNDGHNNGHNKGHNHNHHGDCDYYYDHYDYYHGHHHGWSSGFYVGFDWGWYWGYGWSPASWGSWYWPFWYPEPVTLAYVPYGFYYTQPTVWVSEVRVVEQVPVYVREEVPVYVSEGVPAPAPSDPLVRTSEYQGTSGAAPTAPEAIPEPLDPLEGGPLVLDAATEKYLRDGSQAFAEARYAEAAEAFRLAVVSSPEAAAPRFAFGQALIAMGDYPYAARVLREAVTMEPAILNAPGSIAGVYRDGPEFSRVMAALRDAVLEKRDDPDRLFLLGYQQYLSGDAQAVVTFSRLRERFGSDPTLALFEPALEKRFPSLGQFPPAGGAK
jgi:hypothetical protein